MVPRIAFTLLLAAGTAAAAQAPVATQPETPKDPRALLDAAAKHYDFDSPEMKPWHLKATYQLYDLKGDPAERGTWEYWWASPKVHRSSWTRGGAERTEWHTQDGNYRSGTSSDLKFLERTLRSKVLPNLPGKNDLNSPKTLLDGKREQSGAEPLNCVQVRHKWEHNGKLETPPLSVAQAYCMDPSTLAMRTERSPGGLATAYGQILEFQHRYVARHMEIVFEKRTLLSAEVETVEEWTPESGVLMPPPNAMAVAEQIDSFGDGVAGGELTRMVRPTYPASAKMTKQQGPVLVGATVGIDGRVNYLDVLAAPSPLFVSSATQCVEGWEYKPFTYEGKPVEMNMLLGVIYTLDH